MTEDVKVKEQLGEGDKKVLAICMPHRGSMTSKLSHFFLRFQKPDDLKVMFFEAQSSSIASNRNKMVDTALKRDDTEWILQIDSDQVVDPDTPLRLMNRVRDNHYLCTDCENVFREYDLDKDEEGGFDASTCPHCGEDSLKSINIRMLSALTFIYENKLPIPLVPHDEGYDFNWIEESGLIRTHRLGTGGLLTHRSVYEEIDRPWFQDEYDEKGFRIEAEDFHFSKKVDEAGIPMFVDANIVVDHIKEVPLSEYSNVISYALKCEDLESFKRGF